MNPRTLPLIIMIILTLAACQAAGSPSASLGRPSASADATETPEATESAAESDEPTPTAAPTTDPVPSDDLGPFSCEFPVVEDATAPPNVHIVDVRIGAHEGYDRVVFEFDSGTPEFSFDVAEPPFLQDASGIEVEVEGNAFFQLVMRNGTTMGDDGGDTYGGDRDFDPGFTQLVDLIQLGDFEAQATWVLGLNAETCARVFLLSGPDRLVIDVEH